MTVVSFPRRRQVAPSYGYPHILDEFPPWMRWSLLPALPLLRQMALNRHWRFHHQCEADQPERWAWHLEMIRWGYGW